MSAFAERVRSGEWRGHTGKRIRAVVNIGIGGSDLGPAMAYDALRAYSDRGLTMRFVSNVDSQRLRRGDARPRPGGDALHHLLEDVQDDRDADERARARATGASRRSATRPRSRKHFVAVSTNAEAVAAFGIDTDNMFGFWDWVGGRYSFASAIGLSLMVAIGPERFAELHAGMYAMDEHFRTAPLAENLPVLLGLLGVWYIDLFGAETLAVLPYDNYLARLPAYLQQLDMESNGKHVDARRRARRLRDRARRLGPAGHERPARVLPADPPGHAPDPVRLHRLRHVAEPARPAPRPARREPARADRGAGVRPHARRGRGRGRPRGPGRRTASSRATARRRRCSPRRSRRSPSGSLVALYEHRVFTQGTIWEIDSFDQWGVELGKALAGTIAPELEAADEPQLDHDSSTTALIRRYRSRRATG